MIAILFKSMAESIRETVLAAVKVNAGSTNMATKINSNNIILGKNLSAMVKTRCEGCRKL